MKLWYIISLNPTSNKNKTEIEIIASFDSILDAKFVLDAFNKVNVNFNVYRVISSMSLEGLYVNPKRNTYIVKKNIKQINELSLE